MTTEAPCKGQRCAICALGHDLMILKGIPAGVWADAWALVQEAKGESFSGVDLIDVAPEPPVAARVWAHRIADAIVEKNTRSLFELYTMAVAAGYPYGKEHFGYHLGMQAVGHGVSFSDDCDLAHDAIEIPGNHEFVVTEGDDGELYVDAY